MPARRHPVVVAIGVLAAAMAAVLAMAAALLVAWDIDADDRGPRRSVGDGLMPADVVRGTPLHQPAPLAADTDLDAWAADVATRHRLPERVVRAYGAAELEQRERTPDCGLSWATLAGIGRVESEHGRIGPAEVDADGVTRPPIIGIPLDGTNGSREIRDTDGGRLDGDVLLDRAVGPMQFLPTTWRNYGADGNGDGVRDPQQIDDATLAAARYLCADDRDTASGTGWWDGVLTYNRSLAYGQLVWAAAERYAGPGNP